MSDATDRILDIIDGGLQSSIEHGFRVDNSPNACIRCLKTEPAEGGDLCRGCRAFLLGDSRVDPKPRPMRMIIQPEAALQALARAEASLAEEQR
jgi:hypothetical protein